MIDSLEKALQGKTTATKLTFESQLINTYTLTNNKIFKSITKSDNIPSVINLESLTTNIDHSIANLLTSTLIQFFTIHPLSPNIDNLPSIYDSLSSITSLLQMFLKLLFHWMLRSLLVWTKSLPEYCRAVLRP